MKRECNGEGRLVEEISFGMDKNDSSGTTSQQHLASFIHCQLYIACLHGQLLYEDVHKDAPHSVSSPWLRKIATNGRKKKMRALA